MLLSLGVFFTILSNGNVTLLQGMSKLKEMAKSSFISALIGLFFSIPLFYFFKEKGIVFSIIVTSISSFSCSSQNLPSVSFGQPGKEHGLLGFLGIAFSLNLGIIKALLVS